jgi:hypothetical protein
LARLVSDACQEEAMTMATQSRHVPHLIDSRGDYGTEQLSRARRLQYSESMAMLVLRIIEVIATASAGACWFMSARVKLTEIAPGLEELDKVTRLASDLQTMGDWNYYAALSACIGALVQVFFFMIP